MTEEVRKPLTTGCPSGTHSERVYDWWSRHPRALDIWYGLVCLGRERTFRRKAIERLSLTPGERVLEVGCGYGNSFAALRDAIGSHGSVVGFDISGGMVDAARRRLRRTGWQNVHVLRGDARHLPVIDTSFNAAYSAMSLSAIPDPAAAIKAIRSVLRPGGRLVILDAQPVQQWPWKIVNSVINPIAKRLTNWVPEIDLLAVLRREFETVDCTTFNAGTILIAEARKGPNE